MHMIRTRYVVVALALVFTCTTNSFGQVGSEITGIVTDPSGLVVPGVAVIVTEVSTNTKNTLETNSQGVYYVRVRPGMYDIEASFAGFKTVTAAGLRVFTAEVFRYDITMEIGDVAETVEVAAIAGAVSLQTDTVQISTDVPAEIFQYLPVVTRHTWEMIDISPTVRFSTAVSGRGFNLSGYQPFVSAAGNPGSRGHNFYIDGSNTEYNRIVGDNGNMPVINPPPESVQELRLIVSNYGAEYGEGAGLTIITTTKSGTNQLRGSVYNYMQNRSFDARNTFLPETPPHNYNQFGGTVGGPIIKNKTFFFVNIDGQLELVASPKLLTTPTALMKAGDFSQSFSDGGSLIPIYDPATTVNTGTAESPVFMRQPFLGNVVPASRIDSVSNTLTSFWPAPNAPGTVSGANNLLGTGIANDLNRDYQGVKLDHNFNENHRIFMRYMKEFTDPGVQGPLSEHACCTSSDPDKRFYTVLSRVWQAGHTAVLTPTLISDFRFWWSRFQFISQAGLPEDFQTDWAGRLGLQNLGPDVFPIFSITGVAQIGAGGFAQNYAGNYYITGPSLTVTNIRGKHTLKMGGVYKYSAAKNLLRLTPSGRFFFAPAHTAQPLEAGTGIAYASFMLGEVDAGEQVETTPNDRRSSHISLFVQDDWKVRPNLTLNIGFRYEYDTPAYEVGENSSFLFAADGSQELGREVKINPVSGTPGVITFARDIFARTFEHVPLHDSNKWHVAPRFGFAWNPRQNLVIRGGYGWYLPGADWGNIVWNGPFHGGTVINFRPTSDALGLQSPFTLENAIPEPPRPQFNDSFGSVPVGEQPIFNPEIYWQPRPLAYSQQFNLAVQKQLRSSMFVTLSYLANLVRHVPIQGSLNHNQIPTELLGPGGPGELQARRPFPQFGNISSRGVPHGTSNYHAGILQFTRNFSSGLAFTTHYTWAKQLDSVSYYRDFYQLGQQYGPAPADVRHRYIFAGTYELPFGHGKPNLSSGPAAQVLGGWSLTGRYELTSGRPQYWGNAQNTTNSLGGQQGVNLTSKPAVFSSNFDPRAGTWFDTSVVQQPDPFTFGAAHTQVYGPGYNSLDVALIKKIRFTERYLLDLRADFFDLFNHPNYNNPNTTFNTPGFGTIVSTVSPGGNRVIQLSLKLYF